MQKKSIITGALLLVVAGLLLVYSPNLLTTVILAIMLVTLILGFWFCLMPLQQFEDGFRTARTYIARSLDIQTDTPFFYVAHLESFFHNRVLDGLFREFVKMHNEKLNGHTNIPFGIEDVLDEEILAIRSYREPASQIPGILTGLGLLGTFIGLLIGVGNIGFSSVTTAISSLQILLDGIRTAFYSSIAGVILSLLFNLIYRVEWNAMLHQLDSFYRDFHRNIVVSVEQQQREAETAYRAEVLRLLGKEAASGKSGDDGASTGRTGL